MSTFASRLAIRLRGTAAALAGLLLTAGSVNAAIEPGFDSTTLSRFDDGGFGPVPIGFEIDLFGSRRSTLFVNNNGNVTFDRVVFEYTPFSLLSTQELIIAPFFGDVDTSAAGDPVRFGTGTFQGRRAFGANWVNVDYFISSPNHTRRNSFQLLLVERADRGSGDFDIVFNYDRIQWEAGEASGGVGGLGGFSARAGYAIGRGAPGSAFELAGSALNGALVDGGSNALTRGSRGSQVAGRYIFEVRASNRAAQVSAITPFADAPSFSANSSADGRFVIYQSQAGNLVPGGQRGRNDIYLTNTSTGSTQRLSVVGNALAGSGASEPAVSGDGTLALFASDATLGAAGKGSATSTLLRNLVTQSTQRVGGASTSGTTAPRFSASGNALVITRPVSSASEGLVGQDNVYLVRLTRNGDSVTSGAEVCITCKSINADGSNSTNNSDGVNRNAVLNADATVVAWETTAKNLLVGSAPTCVGTTTDVMLRTLATGVTQRISQPASGGACDSGGSRAPSIDFSGGGVAFETDLPLGGSDQNAMSDVYFYDVASGTRTHLSAATGAQANGASTQPAISGDGLIVAFSSAATNLDASTSDSNNRRDVHVRRINGGQTVRLSLSDSGEQADGDSTKPSLNFDGSRVTFESDAGNLAAGAVAGQLAVFQRANPLAAPSTELKTATWWNPSESGWGLFTLDQGNVLAAGWFTFDTDGEPTWFLLPNAVPQADGAYQSPILRYTGVPLAQIVGSAADAPSTLGQGRLRFVGRNLLSYQYTIGALNQTKQLERFPFGPRDVSCQPSPQASRATATNYSDLWYSAAAPGWGVHISHLTDVLYATWYTYDTDREATYMIAPMNRQSANSFSGDVLKQANGTPYPQIAGNVASGGPASSVGTASLVFTNGETATFSYSVGGVSQNKLIQRLQAGSTASVCQDVPFEAQSKSAETPRLYQLDAEGERVKGAQR